MHGVLGERLIALDLKLTTKEGIRDLTFRLKLVVDEFFFHQIEAIPREKSRQR